MLKPRPNPIFYRLYILQRFWCDFTCVIIFSTAKVTSTNSLEAFCRLTNKRTSFWTWIAISVIQSLLRYIYTSSSAVAWMVNKWESSCFIEPTKQCQWCDFHYRIIYRTFLDFDLRKFSDGSNSLKFWTSYTKPIEWQISGVLDLTKFFYTALK